MSNYTNPDGQSMDDMNELREKYEIEARIWRECQRIIDDKDVLRPIPARHHIKFLLRRISMLEQNLLNQVNENQEPY